MSTVPGGSPVLIEPEVEAVVLEADAMWPREVVLEGRDSVSGSVRFANFPCWRSAENAETLTLFCVVEDGLGLVSAGLRRLLLMRIELGEDSFLGRTRDVFRVSSSCTALCWEAIIARENRCPVLCSPGIAIVPEGSPLTETRLEFEAWELRLLLRENVRKSDSDNRNENTRIDWTYRRIAFEIMNGRRRGKGCQILSCAQLRSNLDFLPCFRSVST